MIAGDAGASHISCLFRPEPVSIRGSDRGREHRTGKRPGDGSRKSNRRTGERFYVRVPVPKALQATLKKKVIEQALGTADPVRARDLARERTIEIKRMFARVEKGGGLTADELKAARENELRRAYDLLAGNLAETLDELPKMAGEIAEDAALLELAQIQAQEHIFRARSSKFSLYFGGICPCYWHEHGEVATAHTTTLKRRGSQLSVIAARPRSNS